jgi:CheY-like chemotaxis protein
MNTSGVEHQLVQHFDSNHSISKKLKILLIDDDPEMSDLVVAALEAKTNCSAEIATDPFEAMNKISETFYDLVILDWKLPALTGGETLRQVEKGLYFDPELPIQWDNHKVPVVIFSSSDKAQCSFTKTKHFKYLGFVSKNQKLNAIVEAFSVLMAPLSQEQQVSAGV